MTRPDPRGWITQRCLGTGVGAG